MKLVSIRGNGLAALDLPAAWLVAVHAMPSAEGRALPDRVQPEAFVLKMMHDICMTYILYLPSHTEVQTTHLIRELDSSS